MPRIGRGRAATARAAIRSVPSPPMTMYRSGGLAVPPGMRASLRRPRARAVSGSNPTTTPCCSRKWAQRRAARRASAARGLATIVTVAIDRGRALGAMDDPSQEALQIFALDRPGDFSGEVQEELAVSLGAQDGRGAGGAHGEAGRPGGGGHGAQRLLVLLGLTDDAAPADLAPADLELRLHQR